MSVAIEVCNVSKSFRGEGNSGPKLAVDDVSFNIAEGEAFGFIGANGAGKSTLIKILMGALRPSSGSAFLFGKEIGHPLGRVGLGFVPENPSLQDYLTPMEILMMGVRLHGVELPDEHAHCMQWLERFSLEKVADKCIRTFSKGMAQRVALAHALAINPRLLILDEPLSGLDPIGRRDVVDILGDYRQHGGTLFFSSHVLHDVERIADRFGLIADGRLVTIRSPRDVILDQADVYVLRFRSEHPVADSVEIRPGLHVIEAAASAVPARINDVLCAGGVLQDVLPKHSLETVFFKLVGQPVDKGA